MTVTSHENRVLANIIKIPENVELALELGNRQRLEEFGGVRRRQEDEGKFWNFLETD